MACPSSFTRSSFFSEKDFFPVDLHSIRVSDAFTSALSTGVDPEAIVTRPPIFFAFARSWRLEMARVDFLGLGLYSISKALNRENTERQAPHISFRLVLRHSGHALFLLGGIVDVVALDARGSKRSGLDLSQEVVLFDVLSRVGKALANTILAV